MCPDCDRGLTFPRKEVCETCAGTGFYNPHQSLPVNETPMDEEAVVDAPVVEEVADEVVSEAPVVEEVAPEVVSE